MRYGMKRPPSKREGGLKRRRMHGGDGALTSTKASSMFRSVNDTSLPFALRKNIGSAVRWVAKLAPLLLVVLAPGAGAWESDVHYGLTKWLAQQAGIAGGSDEVIAKADWDQDHGTADARTAVFHSACLPWAKDSRAADEVRQNHFAGPIPVPEMPGRRPVQSNGKFATSQVEQALAKAGASKDPSTLGRALHALQDSWSHEGIPGVPSVLFLSCDELLAWSHPDRRGGWPEHLADLTYMDGKTVRLEDTWVDVDGSTRNLFYCGKTCEWKAQASLETAKETLRWLVAYRMISAGKVPDRAEVDKELSVLWGRISNEVEGFRKADTRVRKENWFVAHGFTNTKFLDESSLPISQSPPPPVSRKTSRAGSPREEGLRKVALDFRKKDVIPDAAMDFAVTFVKAWSTSKSLEDLEFNVVRKYVEPKSFMRSICGNDRVPEDVSLRVAKFLAIWRDSDHGYIANPNLGHGRIDLCAKDSYALPEEIANALKLPSSYDRLTLAVTSENTEKLDYVTLFRFVHAPYDAVDFHISRQGEGWRVDGLTWMVEH